MVADTAATLELEAPAPTVFYITQGQLNASGSNVLITWQSVPGATYSIMVNTNLLATGDWFAVQTGIPSGGTSTTYSFANTLMVPYAFLTVKKE